jgi:hypothetical protein
MQFKDIEKSWCVWGLSHVELETCNNTYIFVVGCRRKKLSHVKASMVRMRTPVRKCPAK